MASLDPTSIVVAGILLGAASISAAYGRRCVAKKRHKPNPKRSVRVSDARLYGRYGVIRAAFEEAGVVREEHETPEEYARRAASTSGETGVRRLGEIYLYARFCNAVPADLVDEFDRLEPDALKAAERLREASRL